MVFSSALFLFYFLPVFLAGYLVMPSRWRNLYTTAASLFFYAWGAPDFLFIFLGSCLADYLLAKEISRSATEKRRRVCLWLSTAINVGLLAYFKYANFFVEQISVLFSSIGLSAAEWQKVILPIGISFFTFHKISYVVDVYRRTSPPTRNFAEYLLYITFFPQLIAGPIVRYHEIEDQIRHRTLSWDGVTRGTWRFMLGLGSKVLIADPLASIADHVFNLPPHEVSTAYTWLGTLAYTMQIYFDFAGYSSMAVGLALMVGFRFPENFNHPYIAGSITEFWRRWHMSLSRWMRDYLYIPLGGNRVSPTRQMTNLWIVFLFSGLWHGAEWTFIVWGAYHGFFLAIERTALGKQFLQLSPGIRRATTFIVVMFGWVLFRSASLSEALSRWGRMLGFGPEPLVFPRAAIMSDLGMCVLLGACTWCLIIEPLLEKFSKREGDTVLLYERHPLVYPLIIVVCILSIMIIEAGKYSPFIYFRF